MSHAVNNWSGQGPYFGNDIGTYASNVSSDYTESYCKKTRYEKKIRDIEGDFTIEDYEVFQILKNET